MGSNRIKTKKRNNKHITPEKVKLSDKECVKFAIDNEVIIVCVQY